MREEGTQLTGSTVEGASTLVGIVVAVRASRIKLAVNGDALLVGT